VIKGGSPGAAVCAWQPDALAGRAEVPSALWPDGTEAPFTLEAAVLDAIQASLGQAPAFEPEFEAGAAQAAPRFQSFEFKRLEPGAPAPPPAPRAEQPRPQAGFSTWAPAELEPPAAGVSGNAGLNSALANELLAEARLALHNAQAQAVETLRQAEARAAEILAGAERQAAEAVQRAEAQAGEINRQGYSDGMAAAAAEMGELLRTTSAIVDEVNRWREDTFDQSEMMILRLVIEIAQTMFGDGLPLDPETLGSTFSRALAHAKTLGDLRIYVHPEDAAALSAQWPRQQSVASGQQIELIASEIIKRGGCFIEGQFGAVDSRVESQMKLVQETLLATQAAAAGGQA
jgi:flagellar assembly protein FliH